MTAETSSLSPALVLARALPWLRQPVKPVRAIAKQNKFRRILSRHVLSAAVANADRRCHDDVTALTAHIDIGLCQRAGAVGHGPGRIPLEDDMLPAARRYLGVRCW